MYTCIYCTHPPTSCTVYKATCINIEFIIQYLFQHIYPLHHCTTLLLFTIYRNSLTYRHCMLLYCFLYILYLLSLLLFSFVVLVFSCISISVYVQKERKNNHSQNPGICTHIWPIKWILMSTINILLGLVNTEDRTEGHSVKVYIRHRADRFGEF